jgi:hypothetical protein
MFLLLILCFYQRKYNQAMLGGIPPTEEEEVTMRHFISCITLLTICMFAQVLMPAGSLAESLQAQTQMVEASLIPGHSQFEEAEAITIPTLPRNGRHYRHAEFQYYQHLGEISGEICDNVREKLNQLAPGTNEASNKGFGSTGFITQLETFNKTRKRLNMLLDKFGLGLAPDIEDFSEVSSLYSVLPREPQRPALEYGYSVDSGGCTFRIVTTVVGGAMK